MANNFNKTAYHFLCCMKFIINNNIFTIEQLNNYLESNNIFLEDKTILKYIRTLKTVGFKFERINNKIYKLLKIPVQIDLTDNERDILLKLRNILNGYFIDKDLKNSFFNKLQLFLPNDFGFNFDINTCHQIDILKKYCIDGLRLNLSYCNNDKIYNNQIFEPNKLFVSPNNIYLNGYNIHQKTNMLIDISKIIKIKQSPVKNKFSFNKQNVTLKIMNKFANAYILKDGEEIISKKENELIISSFYYDKILFFKNILRYMENCQIIAPQSLRSDFLVYIKEMF